MCRLYGFAYIFYLTLNVLFLISELYQFDLKFFFVFFRLGMKKKEEKKTYGLKKKENIYIIYKGRATMSSLSTISHFSRNFDDLLQIFSFT